MKISAYPDLPALTAGDVLVARTPQQVTLSKVTAAALATYLLADPVPAHFLTAGTNRVLMETGELLLLETGNGSTDRLVQNLDELTAPEFGDLVVAVEALSGATKSVRMSELAAYLVVVSTAPTSLMPHLLTEAGDTLASEASDPIEVE